MRSAIVLASAMLATAFFVSLATPTTDAVGICVTKIKETVPSDACDGIVCVGYNSQTGWQNCVPPEIYCLHTDCCNYVGGPAFYCPDPK